jgi:hypothetical protein
VDDAGGVEALLKLVQCKASDACTAAAAALAGLAHRNKQVQDRMLESGAARALVDLIDADWTAGPAAPGDSAGAGSEAATPEHTGAAVRVLMCWKSVAEKAVHAG